MSNDERFLVSGWEDDLNDIDEEENPHGSYIAYYLIFIFTHILFILKKRRRRKFCGLQRTETSIRQRIY